MKRAVAVIFALGLLASACGGTSDETGEADTTATRPRQDVTDEPVYGGTLVYGLSTETDGWDPTTSQWGPWSLTVARTIFDTLTIFDEDGVLHPHLAESFTPNEDFTEWTIKLRPGITFHNGEPLTAQALKTNWDFFTASPLTERIFARIAFTEVVSELELKATTVQKWVNFPAAFTTQIGVVMAPASLTGDAAERANNPIGTGPFVFTEWVRDQKLVVERNDDYWQEGLPYLDAIEFRPLADATSRVSSMKAGDLDLGYFDAPEDFTKLEEDDEFLIWEDPTTETPESFVMLNTQVPPLDDVRVRRALAHATDNETVVQVVNDGNREPAYGPYRPSSSWYTETDYPRFDPDAARALVEEYEAEVGPIGFTVWLSSGSSRDTVSLLKEMWDAVGIDAEIIQGETATQIAKVLTGGYDAVMWRQYDSPTPLQESVWWHPEGGLPPGQISLNFARNYNETTGAALDEARMVETSEAEYDQYAIVQEQLAQDVPYIWISHIDHVVVGKTDVIDVLNYTIPDADARAMSFMNSAHQLQQVWLNR